MMQKNSLQNNYAAIYCRLSQEDKGIGDSQSIQNQKSYLRNYVLERGWKLFDIYVDDGYSGTNFDRPAFKQMVEDIESGHINIVVTKDLSRLGRNYIQTGHYTEEFFPKYNVRYIAVNDNVDTSNEEENDFAPFKNIINEWYAKDISKKIRFTINNMMKSGKPTRSSFPVYGYMFDEDNNRIPDPTTSKVVKYIFEKYIECQDTGKIAQELKQRKVVIPGYYNYLTYNYDEQKYISYTDEQKYDWDRNTIYKILVKQEYLGDYIRCKTKKAFKSKVTKRTKLEEQYIFPEKFEPLISKDTYDTVKTILSKRLDSDGVRKFNPYRGLVICGLCGSPLRMSNNKEYGVIRLYCRKTEGVESASILMNDLDIIVQNEINDLKSFILVNEKNFMNYAKTYSTTKTFRKSADHRFKEIERLKSQLTEFQQQERSVFEDYHKNNISRETYLDLLKSFSDSVAQTKQQILKLEEQIEADRKNEAKDDYYNIALKYIDTLKQIDFDSDSKSIYLSKIFAAISIKCGNKILHHKKRNVEVNFTYYGNNEMIRGFINECSVIKA